MKLKILEWLTIIGWGITAFFLTLSTINMLYDGNIYKIAMLITLIGFWTMSVAVFIGEKVYKEVHKKDDKEY